jgi:hypothetical protein
MGVFEQRLRGNNMKLHIRILALSLLSGAMFLPNFSSAEAFGKAVYDSKTDELIVTILYSGTNPNHEFSLRWDPCIAHPDGTTDVRAEVIDSQERDEARQEYKKTVHLSLRDLTCRPARVTLRAGPRTYVALQVPAAP